MKMTNNAIEYQFRFSDFQLLQKHMSKRLFLRNRARYGWALFGVVLCALFITLAVLINVQASRMYRFVGMGYSNSVLLALIVTLSAAILSLWPAIPVRVRTLQTQVSDDEPLLGATQFTFDDKAVPPR